MRLPYKTCDRIVCFQSPLPPAQLMHFFPNRFLQRLFCLLFGAIVVTGSHIARADTTLKVGDQKLQTRGILEASGQLKDVPYKIEWFNFPAAQPLGEALNAGAIDVGGLGDAPLIFAYAAGARV